MEAAVGKTMQRVMRRDPLIQSTCVLPAGKASRRRPGMVVRSKPGRLSNTQGTVAVHHSGEPLVPRIMTAPAVTVRQKLRFRRKWEIGGM
jgi:hypothetical protein